MKKELATFISGTNCIKGLELKKQTATLLHALAVIDFGLDLAANESRNPTKQKQACRPRGENFRNENSHGQPADLQRSASWPTRTN